MIIRIDQCTQKDNALFFERLNEPDALVMRGADFAELETFVAIARLKSFRRAGEELNLSSSATSHSLRALEQRIGAKLFNRTTRSVSLTDAGIRLLQRIEPAFDEIKAAVSEAGVEEGVVTGIVRLNMPRQACQMLMTPILGRFSTIHPSIRLEVFVDDKLVDIVAAGFDAGIRLSERVQLDMVAVRLSADLRGIVVGSPEYLSKNPEPQHPTDLQKHRCINYRSSSASSLMKWEFERDGERIDLAVEGPLTTNDTDLQLAAALDGVGLACLTECMVLDHINAKRLVPVLSDWCQPFPGWHLYYPQSRMMVPALRSFIDFMKR